MAYYVYMMSNKHRTTLYTRVTANLAWRVEQHRAGIKPSFTERYQLFDLVYVEVHDELHAARDREYRVKRWHRVRKNKLVESINPDWRDLSNEWL